MKKYLIALSVGIAATVVFTALAAFGGGACHCSTPVRVLFPYVAMLGRGGHEGIVGSVLLALQFPVYALVLARVENRDRRAGAFFILFLVHLGVAVVVSQMASRS